MRFKTIKGLWLGILLIAALGYTGCTKEDDGLTKEAREAVEMLRGDYGCHFVTWTPEIGTKSGVLVLVDTTEAKSLGGVDIRIEGMSAAGDKGTIRIEIPFFGFVSNFFSFFNHPVPDGMAGFPKSWVVEVRYEIDDKGNVFFPEYDFEGIKGYLIDVSLLYDLESRSLTLNVATNVGEDLNIDLGAFFNEFFSGEFRVCFVKK